MAIKPNEEKVLKYMEEKGYDAFLVSDPTMGYGIFIENMLEAAG